MNWKLSLGLWFYGLCFGNLLVTPQSETLAVICLTVGSIFLGLNKRGSENA